MLSTDEPHATEEPLVYFSYRQVGSADIAARLASRLREEAGVEVFFSQEITPGAPWRSALQEGLARAEAMVIFIDENWLRYQDEWGRRRLDDPRDWLHQEIARALEENLQILPVLVEEARMPPKQALPEALSELPEYQALRIRRESFEADSRSVLEWARGLAEKRLGAAALSRAVHAGEPQDKSTSDRSATRSTSQLKLKRIEIRGFRSFDRIEVDFERESTLDGRWTCLVGLNGAGKSSILQATALILMGPSYALELGRERLQSMRRRTGEERSEPCVLRAWAEYRRDQHYLEMILEDEGPVGSATNLDRERPSELWEELERLTIVSYGASRNLSDSPDRWDGTSATSQSHISLFDPMARLVRTKELLQREGEHARALFAQLLGHVFTDEAVSVESADEVLRFRSTGSVVRAHDLADGFRSSVTWMAHFCARAASLQPSASKIQDLSGLVLVDEIDLHLHASLQRKIVPRLREALPNVQFIVTSHSPLIISSFDRNELVVLDRNQPDGLRRLDRQILAFSTDEVYDWLMDTPPRSAALDEKLAEGSDPDLAALLYQSPEVDQEEAEERDRRQEEILAGMGFGDGTEV